MRPLLAACMLLFTTALFGQHYYLFIGTYTSGKSKGIYVYDFDAATGNVKWVSNTDSSANPSFLTIAPDGKHVYAVNEVSRQQAGFVAAYQFDPLSGKLSFINRQSSGSENPCHISITKNGKWLAVANYTGGSLAAFPINADGSIQPFSQHIIHNGKGQNPQRQEKPHVHSVFFSPDNQYLLSPDLGLDQVFVYQFNSNASQPLSPAAVPFATTMPGSGPRHLEFSANGKYVYVIEELAGSIGVFNYTNGALQSIQQMDTHPSGFSAQPGSADIHLSPDGKFLYATNRGEENNIAIFSVNKSSGLLSPEGYQSTLGEQPRNFMIDPTGKYLLVANQKTSNIIVFKRNMRTGSLQELSQFEVPNPVCLKMLAK